MSIADSLVDAAPCSACRSVLCMRNEECPTCSVCGERGHEWCSRGTLEPVLKASLREVPPVRPSWELVAEDLRTRDVVGRQRYGASLRSDSPVDLLTYAYEEALDLVIYLRAEIERRARESQEKKP